MKTSDKRPLRALCWLVGLPSKIFTIERDKEENNEIFFQSNGTQNHRLSPHPPPPDRIQVFTDKLYYSYSLPSLTSCYCVRHVWHGRGKKGKERGCIQQQCSVTSPMPLLFPSYHNFNNRLNRNGLTYRSSFHSFLSILM